MENKKLASPVVFKDDKTGAIIAQAHTGRLNFPDDADSRKLKPLFNAAEEGEKEVTMFIRGKDVEHAVSYDDKGRPFAVSIGDKTTSPIPMYKGGKVLHNHPDGATLSMTDIKAMLESELNEMTAVTEKGEYRLTKRKFGRKLTLEEINSRYSKEYHKLFHKIKDRNKRQHEALKNVFRFSEYKYYRS